MMAQRFSAWISDQLHRAIKVGLPIAAALSFCVRTYGGGNELLFDAIPSGQLRKAQAALAQGIDANVTTASGQTPPILAASLGRVQTVHLLLDRQASINAKDENGATALMAASTWGRNASSVIAWIGPWKSSRCGSRSPCSNESGRDPH